MGVKGARRGLYQLGAVALVLASSSVRADVDWATGRVAVTGAGPADLRAPSPAIARVAAERVARKTARARLETELRALPWAEGVRLEEAWLEGILATVTTDAVRYQSDGSVVVESHVDLVPANATAALVVDARKLGLAPVLGATIVAGKARYDGPLRWVRAAPAGVPVVLAVSARRGTLEIPTAALPAARGAVVVWIAERR